MQTLLSIIGSLVAELLSLLAGKIRMYLTSLCCSQHASSAQHNYFNASSSITALQHCHTLSQQGREQGKQLHLHSKLPLLLS